MNERICYSVVVKGVAVYRNRLSMCIVAVLLIGTCKSNEIIPCLELARVLSFSNEKKKKEWENEFSSDSAREVTVSRT